MIAGFGKTYEAPDEFSLDSLVDDNGKEQQILNTINESSKKIALFPASRAAILFQGYLEHMGLEVSFFIDNSPSIQGHQINNTAVFSLDEKLDGIDQYLLIIIGRKYTNDEICEQLKKHQVENYLRLDDHFFLKKILSKNFDEIKKTYSTLSDNLSKMTFINMLNYRLTQDENFLTPIIRPPENQYFEPDLYAVSEHEHFVDCGAYNGDTVQKFLKKVGCFKGNYFCFEPCRVNFDLLSLKVKGYSNIHLFNKGVYHQEDVLKFQSPDSASLSSFKATDSGPGETVEVVSIDQALDKKKVTFIKMEIMQIIFCKIINLESLFASFFPAAPKICNSDAG